MRALLVLVGALVTWSALYQGFLALVIVPPSGRDLATVSGILRHVSTPVTRNRFVPSTELEIEIEQIRVIKLAVRRETLSTETLSALLGRAVTVSWAAGRPRNRWVYALEVDGDPLVGLAAERARDVAAQRAAMIWMLANTGLALSLFGTAAWLHRRRKRARIFSAAG